MTDTVNKEKRSEIMGKIRGKDTKPEITVRKFLHSRGYRLRLWDKHFPCHPDIALKKYRTVIFINGCFWHGHEGCKRFKLPKSNIEFWSNKVEANRKRDKRCIKSIEALGWKRIIIWECELKKGKQQQTLQNLNDILQRSLKG